MEYKKEEKNAFVWLLMLGEDYLPGVLVSAHSFRRVETRADLVVMVTEDVSPEAKKILLGVFDYFIEVPYIEVKTKSMRTQKQSKLYNSWISKSYTKWNALGFVNYTKVCLIDADLVTLKNIDELFELSAPAAVFKSSYGRLFDPYKNPKHGATISKKQIWKGLTKPSFVATAYMILLPTSNEYLKGLIKMITEEQPYGFPKCYYGHDEQSISHYMSCYKHGPQLDWTVIDPMYGFNIGKYDMLKKGQVPRVIHYINNPKPWVAEDFWPDLDIWWSLAKDMKVDWTNLKIHHKFLKDKNSLVCYICKKFRLGVAPNHEFLTCTE
jgi:lipopolysaccharide biosynthesis glycosyltransferase